MPYSQQTTSDEFDLELQLNDDMPIDDVTIAQGYSACNSTCTTFTAGTGNRSTVCCAC